MIVPEFPPYVVGGGGAVFERIAKYLASQGHDVTVAHGDFSNVAWYSPHGEREVDHKYKLVPIRLFRTPKQASWLLSAMPPTPYALVKLFNICNSKSWDVAHVHGVGLPLIDIATTILRMLRVPYVYTIHGIPASPLKRGVVPAAVFRTYLRFCTRPSYLGAKFITAVSKSLLNDPLLPIGKGHVIYNGVEECLPAEPLSHAEKFPIRLITTSRLSMNKGIDVVIQAVNELNRANLRVRLDIYGADGGEESALKKLAIAGDQKHAITFKGTFRPSERRTILANYHALVVPSRVEGFGLSALEGLVQGLPVVASNVDGLAEILTGKEGFLLPAGDVVALKNAIVALSDPEIRLSASRAGIKRAHEFLWPNQLSRYESLLKDASSAQLQPRAPV